MNDSEGNPIEIAAVVVWKVVETAEASFEVDDYNNYVHVQSEAALRNLSTSYAYDSHVEHQMSRRGNTAEVAAHLKTEIQDRLAKAGVETIEARISHLAYAPVIAAAMLQRQQASAIIAARTRIVEGAVGMVEMALESQIGIGSRFWFTFGNRVDSELGLSTQDKSMKETDVPETASAYVLLVDDSLTNQAVLSAMLRSGGVTVDVADSGAQAIAKVQGSRYDMVFMDVSMPDMNGLDATRAIRQLSWPAASVPVIAMTAHAVKGYEEECLAAGMND